ncbi:IclR family transcriptional regulator [Polaromonas sp. P2-4]|nr:IclR family transcriptional regulator [Polaromonas sp. P2-4]
MSNSRSSLSPSRVPAGFHEYEADRQFATTLARGLELLRCFTPDLPVLGNKELSRRLGLPTATISRLTYTLMCMGYLAQTESYGKYRLGSAVLSLGYPLLQLFKVRRQARPLMLELAEETGSSVSIGIRDRLSIVYIEAIRASAHGMYPLDVGTTHSLAGTAIGRAYLMACLPKERDALLNQLRVKSPEEWTLHGEKLMRNLTQYARTGCCVSVGEIHPDVQAVAVPLGRIDRSEVAAINCSFQGLALDETWLREKIAPKLTALARRIM